MVTMIIEEFASEPKTENQLYENITPTETLMGSLLMKYPYLIEQGLTYLDHHIRTGEQVRMDLLFADSDGALVIAELNVEETEDILLGCLEYYDEISSNLEGYTHIFGEKYGISIDPSKKPRMLLIAPGFGAKFIEKCRWLDMDVSAFTFKCIKPRFSEFVLPVFNEVRIPPKPIVEAKEVPEKEDDDKEGDIEVVIKADEDEEKKPMDESSYRIYFGDTEEDVNQKVEFEESVEKLETDYEPKDD